MRYFWLAGIPAIIFAGALIGQLLMKWLADDHEKTWWSFPLYMALFSSAFILAIGGIVFCIFMMSFL